MSWRRLPPLAAAFLGAAFLASCAANGGLVPGRSTQDDVISVMGAPADVRALANGDRVLWYPRTIPGAAYGTENFAATIAPDGRLRSLEQRLTPKYVAQLVPDESRAADVLDVIGPPARAYGVIGKTGEVWEYPLQGFQRPLTLYVEVAPDEVVRDVYTLERRGVSSR